MTKTELLAAYVASRGKYSSGEILANEYALELDTMLSRYLGLPLLDLADEDELAAAAEPAGGAVVHTHLHGHRHGRRRTDTHEHQHEHPDGNIDHQASDHRHPGR